MKLRPFIFLLGLLSAPLARADIVVVAHPQSGIERLTREDIVNIYLGRYRRLPSGETAEPIDIQGDNDIKAKFYRGLVGKSLAEINAYWARLVFSGKTRPPLILPTVEEVLRLVARYPGALAYVDRSKVDGRVMIVFEMGD
jgi:hypothetical protein